MNNPPKAKNLAIAGYACSLLLYIHLLFFVAAFGAVLIRNRDIGSSFSTFHLRQMFGIGAIAVLLSIFERVIPHAWIALGLISFMVLLALLGLLSAARNQQTELPYIGSYFQQWFKFIK